MRFRRNPEGDNLLVLALAAAAAVGVYLLTRNAPVAARSGTASTGGSPSTQPGTSRPPAQQAPSGQAPAGAPNVAIVVDFWSNRYSYVAGQAIELSGFVYQWDGKVATRLRGRKVVIVDPDAGGGTPWLEATTDDGGAYRINYRGSEIEHWRSYAIDVASGAKTGILDFYPHITGSGEAE